MRTFLVGETFGRLTVIKENGRCQKTRNVLWTCSCVCGAECTVPTARLRSGNTRSCGCLHKDAARETQATHITKHGQCYSPEYRIWKHIHERCSKPYCKSYSRYGGRGISVCPEWESFEQFYADMGSRPSSKHSIDRIDNDGPYCKENCRWSTHKEQCNNRRSSRIIEYLGETKTLAEWSEKFGMYPGTVSHRLRSGWSVEEALTTPVRGRR